MNRIERYENTGDASLLMGMRRLDTKTHFYVRHDLDGKENWNGSSLSLAYVLEKFYPGVVAYLEYVFEQDAQNGLFFNKVLNKLGSALFDDSENRFSVSCNEFLLLKNICGLGKKPIKLEEFKKIYNSFKRDKEERAVAKAVERELQKNGFLLVHRFGTELYLLGEGKRFVERKKEMRGEVERYWEVGKAEEWIEQNKKEFVTEGEEFLKGMVLEKDEDLRKHNCLDVRLAGKEQFDRMLDYENDQDWAGGYKGLRELVLSTL